MNSIKTKKDEPFIQRAAADVDARYAGQKLSPILRENLEIAAQIDLYVTHLVPCVLNDHKRCMQTFPRIATLPSIERNDLLTVKRALDNACENSTDSRLSKIVKLAKTVEKFGIASCSGLAAVAFNFVLKHFPHKNVEYFHLGEGDHAFISIGRDLKSPAHSFELWDPNTVISDPWGSTYFPISQIKNRLYNLIHCEIQNGHFYAIKEPFHPGKHILTKVQGKPTQRNMTLVNVFALLALIGLFLLI